MKNSAWKDLVKPGLLLLLIVIGCAIAARFLSGQETLAEYLRIDPRTKTACWSDSLDTKKALAIARRFHDRIRVTFGIGTHLTNNLGSEPLSIVMKLTESNGFPVVKLSDAIGKSMCNDASFVDYVKQQYRWRSIDG